MARSVRVQFPMAEAGRPRPVMSAVVDRVCKTGKRSYANSRRRRSPWHRIVRLVGVIWPAIILAIPPNYCSQARTRLRKLSCDEYLVGPTNWFILFRRERTRLKFISLDGFNDTLPFTFGRKMELLIICCFMLREQIPYQLYEYIRFRWCSLFSLNDR